MKPSEITIESASPLGPTHRPHNPSSSIEDRPPAPESYPPPPPELIDDIRKRMAEANIPPDVIKRAEHAMMHEPIQAPGSILYRAGLCLCSAELYEYRKTLFPPNSLVDPLTQDAPVMRNVASQSADSAATDVSASATTANNSESASAPVNRDSTTEATSPPPPSCTDPLSDPLPIDPGTSGRSEALIANDNPVIQPSNNPLSVCVAPADHGPVSSIERPTSPPPPPSSIHPQIHSSLHPFADGSSLLSGLRDIIKRYVVLPPMAAEALALWVMHTYAFAMRNVTVYIGIVSPEKRCGKTTLLTLLGNLAHRSLVASNITPSALFRVIEETQPTLLIDEADTFLQNRDELRGILNAGYKRDSAYVVRVASKKSVQFNPVNHPHEESDRYDETQWVPLEQEKNGTRVVRHSCWCPKVIAAIGRLPDTLADRCIVITMQRKTANEHCERMRDVHAQELRAQCMQWVRRHRDAIAIAQPTLPPNLNDRAADIWEPLLAIADIAGGQWPELARHAALKLSSGEEETTLLGYFLQDLRAVFNFAKTDRMFSRDVVELLNPMHDRPWEDLRRGREINEWWLGQHLREFGIKSRTIWIGDTSAKGYMLGDFEEAFRRYVPAGPGITSDQAPGTKESPGTGLRSENGQKLQEEFELLMAKLEEAAKKAQV